MESHSLKSQDYWLTHQLEAMHFFVNPYIHKHNRYTPEIHGEYLMIMDDNNRPSFHHVNTFLNGKNKFFNIIDK